MSPEEASRDGDVEFAEATSNPVTTATTTAATTVACNNSNSNPDNESAQKRRVHRHTTDFIISGVAWLNKQSEPFQLALSSLTKHGTNYVEIVRLNKDSGNQEIRTVSKFVHRLPPTKLLWMPQSENYGLPTFHSQFGGSSNSLLATTSDHLRLWRVQNSPIPSGSDPTKNGYFGRYNPIRQTSTEVDVKLECVLNQNPNSNQMDPLTSFDWNDVDPRLLVTASLDTTCTLWNIEYERPVLTFKSDTFRKVERLAVGKVSKRFVAHEKPAYGVSFSRYGSGRDVFVSVGGDRSVRSFDSRSLRSLILYETEDLEKKALVRVSCSKQSEHLLSFFAIESNQVHIMDIRKPGELVCTLERHSRDVNCMSWAPHSGSHLSTASDDKQALIWNLDPQTGSLENPILAYRAENTINAMSWSASPPDWIAIAHENFLELLRV